MKQAVGMEQYKEMVRIAGPYYSREITEMVLEKRQAREAMVDN